MTRGKSRAGLLGVPVRVEDVLDGRVALAEGVEELERNPDRTPGDPRARVEERDARGELREGQRAWGQERIAHADPALDRETLPSREFAMTAEVESEDPWRHVGHSLAVHESRPGIFDAARRRFEELRGDVGDAARGDDAFDRARFDVQDSARSAGRSDALEAPVPGLEGHVVTQPRPIAGRPYAQSLVQLEA